MAAARAAPFGSPSSPCGLGGTVCSVNSFCPARGPSARDRAAFEALLGMDNTYTLAAWNDYAAALCNSHQEEAALEVIARSCLS